MHRVVRHRRLGWILMVTHSAGEIRARLSHVRWIGGAPGAGKSTIARRLTDRYGLQLYTVEPFTKFSGRLTPDEAPLLHAFMSMSMDERWLNRPPCSKPSTDFKRKAFNSSSRIFWRCQQMSSSSLGFKLLPRLVAPHLSDPRHAIWLLPTAEFRRKAFDSGGSTWDIPNKTSNPDRTLANLSACDELFTSALTREVSELGQAKLVMDGSLDIAMSSRVVAQPLDLNSTSSDIS